MKKLFRGIILAAVVAGVWISPASAQTRIATVDLGKIRDGFYKTKEADAALRERATDLDKEYKAMREGLKKTNEEYKKAQAEANDQAVSAEERDRRKKAAEEKLKDLKEMDDRAAQFEREARTTLDEQRRRMRDNIVTLIRTALNAKAKSAGYALVIDTSAKSANNTLELISMTLNRVDPTDESSKSLPVVLYAASENDLTETILQQLNAGARIETPKPVEKKVEEPAKTEKK